MAYRCITAALCVWVGAVVPAGAAMRVVATIFPVADIVQQVGKERVEVITLLPPGVSPHTFEPTPAQMRAVAAARVCVRIGSGLDSWADKLLVPQTGSVSLVTLTDGVQLLEGVEGLHGDPHVWLDPVLMRDHAVPVIVAALSAADADGRAAFEQAATEFQAALTELDAEIRAGLETVRSRDYVAFHSEWRYFGQRYGLHEIAVVEPFPGKEPSARAVAAVIEKARAAHVRAILIEPQFTRRIGQQIAREFDGEVLLPDPIGGPNAPERNHYVDLMRYNLRVFIEALR